MSIQQSGVPVTAGSTAVGIIARHRTLAGAVLFAWAAVVVFVFQGDWGLFWGRFSDLISIIAESPGVRFGGLPDTCLSLAGSVLFIAVSMAAALGSGMPVLSLFRHERDPWIEMAAGFFMLSSATAALGFGGLLFNRTLLVIVAVPFVGGLVVALRYWSSRPRGGAGIAGEDRLPWLLFLFAALFWVLISTMPGTTEDSLAYHWAAPQYFLESHRIPPIPYNDHWNFPLTHEMLYLLGLAGGGVLGVNAVNLATLLVAVFITARLGGRLFGKDATAWTAVLFGLMPVFVGQIWTAKNESGATMFFAAAVYALWRMGRPSTSAALLYGAFAGACLSVKYTCIFPVIGTAVLFLWMRPGVRRFLLAVAVMALMAGLWPTQNWLSLGNPFYPFLSSLFPSLWWGSEYESALRLLTARVSSEASSGASYWLLIWNDLLLNTSAVGTATAVLVPAGLVLLLPRRLSMALLAGVVSFLAMFTERNIRFLWPMVPLMALSATAAVLALRRMSHRVYRILLWPLLCLSVVDLLRTALSTIPDVECGLAAGIIDRDEYSAKSWTTLDEMKRWVSRNIPPDSKVLLAGDQRGFGIHRRTISTHVVVMPPVWRWARQSRNAEDMRKFVRQEDFDYIIYNEISARYRQISWAPGPPWDYRSISIYKEFARKYMRVVFRSSHPDYANGYFLVFKIERKPSMLSEKIRALPWTEGLFASAFSMLEDFPDNARYEIYELLRANPDVASMQELGASLLCLSGDMRGAARYYRELAREEYAGESNWMNLAMVESALGHRREAFRALRAAWMKEPAFHDSQEKLLAVLLMNWGYERLRKGDSDGARACLEMAGRADAGMNKTLVGDLISLVR